MLYITLMRAILPDMQAEYNLSYSLRGLLLSFQQCGNLSAMLLAGFLPYLIGRKKCTLILSSAIVVGILITNDNKQIFPHYNGA